VDESTWKKNAENKVYADLVRKCTGVWFTGGDQLRTMQALVLHDEKKTSVLESVWQVYKTGGVLGGTSAGAAIMSETMIGGGTSLAALIHGAVNNYSGEDFPAEKGVLVVKGLGFFPFGIVDQHFHARARIGRLAVAMMQSESDSKLAFGIDENTAMVYNGKDKQFTVAGEGGVTVLNSGNASLVKDNQRIGITGMDISYIEDGSGFDLKNATIIPAENMAAIKITDGVTGKYTDEHGILSTENSGFRNLITQYLIKSGHGEVLKCITTSNIHEAFELDFSKTAGWKAFSTPPGREVRYAISGIRMDILPVNIHYSR
jgi:cyanophycinase